MVIVEEGNNIQYENYGQNKLYHDIFESRVLFLKKPQTCKNYS